MEDIGPTTGVGDLGANRMGCPGFLRFGVGRPFGPGGWGLRNVTVAVGTSVARWAGLFVRGFLGIYLSPKLLHVVVTSVD